MEPPNQRGSLGRPILVRCMQARKIGQPDGMSDGVSDGLVLRLVWAVCRGLCPFLAGVLPVLSRILFIWTQICDFDGNFDPLPCFPMKHERNATLLAFTASHWTIDWHL